MTPTPVVIVGSDQAGRELLSSWQAMTSSRNLFDQGDLRDFLLDLRGLAPEAVKDVCDRWLTIIPTRSMFTAADVDGIVDEAAAAWIV